MIRRPIGINSVLRNNEYTTGRRITVEKFEWYDEYGGAKLLYSNYEIDETAKLVKRNDIFESVLNHGENAVVESVPQGIADYFIEKPQREAA